MDVSNILNDLNEVQREAVSAPDRSLLVLAGAGSGKTRVLVHRISWLTTVENVSPYSILAVTFTNKASAEMRQRVEKMQSQSMAGIWVGTFHGLAHRLLRSHWQQAGLVQSFQILDSDDQLRLVKRVILALELDDTQWQPKQVRGFINACKDEGDRPQHIADNGDPVRRQLVRIYSAYEAACKRAGVIDFAEMLLRSLELLRDNKDLLAHYQQRFRHILVDEFQDTNAIQYAWVRLLVGKDNNIFVVGDDDQAIYGWRGARVENLQKFRKDFPQTRIIKLEQNYRSTATILSAANAVIGNNGDRLGKRLWTAGSDGQPITYYQAYNEFDEARFIIDKIKQWVSDGELRADVAILYRSNAQSRVFEQTLNAEQIPYRIYGGLRYFDRAEIKDCIAYLRLMNNVLDDTAFERIVNVPARGIGGRTLEIVRERAKTAEITMWQAAEQLIKEKALTARAANALQSFLDLMAEMQAACIDVELHEKVEHVIHQSGLIEHHEKDKSEKSEQRIENMEELVGAAKNFTVAEDEAQDMDKITAFLTYAVLESGEGQAQEWEDCVQMMTLHSAKGLEFKQVYICGVEEGLFPHQRSIEDASRLEEERRLCYVGITRAREQLTITNAEHRQLYGRDTYPRASRFISEIPAELVADVRLRTQVSEPQYVSDDLCENETGGFQIGQRVMHPKFGEGMVLNFEGSGAHARLEVNFEFEGTKWLVISYANLSIL
ncbi:MAG: DNA helicase II [Gammaproteobacteria bacterium]|nr:DNA helicase II [Gammaproteobacteria bacterium]